MVNTATTELDLSDPADLTQDRADLAQATDGMAWMNGRVVPIADATVHVTDWGLTRSDITYDVVKVTDGRFFRLDVHLERFARSRERLRIEIPETDDDIRTALHAIVSASGLREAYVSMVASRGKPTVPGSRDPRHCDNHFYAWAVPYIWVFAPDVIARGATLMLPDDRHRIDPQAVDPTVKNYHWGDFTGALMDAKDAGFDSCLLADAAGCVTEGAGFNIFCVEGERVLTPVRGALEGVTRRTCMEVAAELGLAVEAADIPVDRFLKADEAFACTTAGGITPIARVNEREFGVGRVTKRIMERFARWHVREELIEAVNYGWSKTTTEQTKTAAHGDRRSRLE